MKRFSVYLITGIITILTLFTGVSPAWANNRLNEELSEVTSENSKELSGKSSSKETHVNTQITLSEHVKFSNSDFLYKPYLSLKDSGLNVKSNIELIKLTHSHKRDTIPNNNLSLGVIADQVFVNDIEPGDILWTDKDAALYIGDALVAQVNEKDRIIEKPINDYIKSGYKIARL